MSDGLGMGRKGGLRGGATARGCYEGLLRGAAAALDRKERQCGEENVWEGEERKDSRAWIFLTFHLQNFRWAMKC
ncbi:hypothetical protein MRB53_018611 [Persea americana]|uniref:Uncharacterized protein n=1 Tax=Persea americana TaxID=3435 RepID=A0ACC2M8F1_PERAE|nr:hypothetical protein MRB53_018611 [Persea americana]